MRAVLLVGAGSRLTSALSLLTCAVSESHKSLVLCYNLALLKVKLAHDSSTLTPQTLTALQRYTYMMHTPASSIMDVLILFCLQLFERHKFHEGNLPGYRGDHSMNQQFLCSIV